MSDRVLVADDSRVVREVLVRELGAAGWEVVPAGDGAEALDLCRQLAPDIVLLDIEMPRLNGYQVLAAMQRDAELAAIPVLFLTGRDSSSDVAEGLRRGAHDYLRKPFDTTELLARLDLARRMKRLQDELRARNEELERLATTDVLTGLHNRRSIQELLEAGVSRSVRHGTALSVLLVDVDHFKLVNDTHGHAAGDDVLRELSERLRTRLRREDSCGRWGGEELLVLLPDTTGSEAVALGQALRELVAARAFTATGVGVTISVGVAAWDGESADGLVQRADAALYEAKGAGRDAVRQAGAPAHA
jgi:diguanylate cyclase (GGDEF)-like protein